jgi:hypothetical protein
VVSERLYSDIRDESNPLVYRFDAGVHTLTIKQRENGTRLDRILVTNDMAYVPEGAGEQVIQVPQKIWIEAEEGDIFAPMRIANDANASTGEYISAPSAVVSGGYAQYPFDVDVAGDYIIWGRVISNSNSSDSFLISVDGADDIIWHTKPGGQDTWTWDVVSIRDYADVRDESNPLIVHFVEGAHLLTIKQREYGTKIDQILVTNDIGLFHAN